MLLDQTHQQSLTQPLLQLMRPAQSYLLFLRRHLTRQLVRLRLVLLYLTLRLIHLSLVRLRLLVPSQRQ
jgi:hypothetical protein